MRKTSFFGSNIWLWLLLGLSGAYAIFQAIRSSKKNQEPMKVESAPFLLSHWLTFWLNTYGFDAKMVRYVLALGALESGRYESELYVYANNPWGMMDPRGLRDNAADGEYKGFAEYQNTYYAAKDFCLYLLAVNSPKTFGRFYDFIAFIQSKNYTPGTSAFAYYQACLNAAA